jgi:deazaflavin-dependent oxidoreductase (nitroreductase family)
MTEALDRKVRREILIGRYVANPLVRGMFRIGLTPPHHTMIETTGRKTGLTRRVPVTYGRSGREVWVIAQHGRKAGWVRNLEADPSVRLLLGGQWVGGTAELVPDDDVHARARSFASQPVVQRMLTAMIRALETRPCSVRVTLG